MTCYTRHELLPGVHQDIPHEHEKAAAVNKSMAEVIAAHSWGDLEGGCLCGWRGEYEGFLDHAVREFTAEGFGPVKAGDGA